MGRVEARPSKPWLGGGLGLGAATRVVSGSVWIYRGLVRALAGSGGPCYLRGAANHALGSGVQLSWSEDGEHRTHVVRGHPIGSVGGFAPLAGRAGSDGSVFQRPASRVRGRWPWGLPGPNCLGSGFSLWGPRAAAPCLSSASLRAGPCAFCGRGAEIGFGLVAGCPCGRGRLALNLLEQGVALADDRVAPHGPLLWCLLLGCRQAAARAPGAVRPVRQREDRRSITAYGGAAR